MDRKQKMEKIADYKDCTVCKGRGEVSNGRICILCGGSGSILVYR